MQNSTAEFWAGSFGDEYTERNQVDWRSRADFWRDIMSTTKAQSVYEFGANRGHNLRAIRACSAAYMGGCEINEKAREQATEQGILLGARNLLEPWDGPRYDLTFTAGVLIHVAPEDIDRAMENVAAASTRWVLAIEYPSEREEEVEYRGHKGRLWKRNFGRLYSAMGLEAAGHGKAHGFDDCYYWLLRKVRG
jgi:pseudaminic acid biosynthesis-associated methylase